MAIKLAIYGYDTDIGKLVIETLEEQRVDLSDVFPLSPFSGEYDAVNINQQNYFVKPIDEFDFSDADFALFLTTQDESQRWVAKARESGCVVIDNSHLFSGDEKTCLILPSRNPFDIRKAIESRLVIPPLAPSVQLCHVLGALHDEFGIAKATVTALESVSEQGRLGTETLAHETTLLLNGMAGDHQGFDAQLAFNLHTCIGAEEENGYSDHENTILTEVLKLLGGFERGFDVTSILVPVFYGHTMVVNVELEDNASLTEVKEVFNKSDMITLKDDEPVLSPVGDIINERSVLVNRVRQVKNAAKTFSFVMMMDNTRYGEAITCVEIVKLIEKNL